MKNEMVIKLATNQIIDRTKMKQTKFQTRITKIAIGIVIPLLLVGTIFLIDDLIKSDKNWYKMIILAIWVIYILIFDFFLISVLVKNEIEILNDSRNKMMHIFSVSMFSFMIIIGIIDVLIFKTLKNIHLLFIGLMLLINVIILRKREMKNKNGN